MLLDGFDLKIQNIPYFDQSVAYDGDFIAPKH
jgi:hypothetical protein